MVARSWLSGEEFHVGDIVTRDGHDRHVVLWTEDDLIEVECVKAGAWEVGERERNLARRYSLITAPATVRYTPRSTLQG